MRQIAAVKYANFITLKTKGPWSCSKLLYPKVTPPTPVMSRNFNANATANATPKADSNCDAKVDAGIIADVSAENKA
jgi:hypothetical protein